MLAFNLLQPIHLETKLNLRSQMSADFLHQTTNLNLNQNSAPNFTNHHLVHPISSSIQISPELFCSLPKTLILSQNLMHPDLKSDPKSPPVWYCSISFVSQKTIYQYPNPPPDQANPTRLNFISKSSLQQINNQQIWNKRENSALVAAWR